MKKTKYLFLTACISIGLIALSGCGADQYGLEKEYWHLQKQAEKIFKNPDATPPRELERMVSALNRFIERHPQSNLSIEARFNIAKLYIAKDDFKLAREQLKNLMDKYSKSEIICSEALFLIGSSYETNDKWDEALKQYKALMEKYPLTPKGMDMPFYIVQHYKTKYQPDKMVEALREAAAHFKGLAGKHPNTPLAYNADILTAQCYALLKDWNGAIATFNHILEAYNGKVTLDEVLINMAAIYNRELKDKAKAKEALERLIKDYPKSKLLKTADALLKELDKNEN